MLEIKSLTFSYPKKQTKVIDDLSIIIERGSIYGLLGPNGAGKSTLLYLIAGLLTPKSGEVLLDGINTRKRTAETLADIFIVPEEIDLPKIPLDKYVSIVGKYYPNFSSEQLQAHLEEFGIEANPDLGALSMGQKKKVYMSVALAANTPVLLMDEPTNGLDIPGKATFRSAIASSITDERIIIISTHQVRDVSNIIDHVLIMNQNQIIFDSDLYDITRKYKFMTTTDQALISRALVAQPELQGVRIVLPNDDGQETSTDLELLFELATKKPNLL